MKIFRFVKKVFFLGLTILSNFTNALDCISMKNQECKVRPEIININSNNPIFYPFSVGINRCSGKCNNINDPYARLCVPDIVKNLNVTVFNLMPLTNDTRSIKWHETCKWICRLNEIICNHKQRWNEEKCRCKCKELIDKRVCDKGYIFNPSNCECECDKSCNIGQYLDYSDRKCKKKLIDLLIEQCTENNDVETKKVNRTVKKENSSCKVYIILTTIVFTIFAEVTIYFVYYNWSFIKNKVFCIKSNTHKETLIWQI